MNPCGVGLGNASVHGIYGNGTARPKSPPQWGVWGSAPRCLWGFIVFHTLENRYITVADNNFHRVLSKVALNVFPICAINHRIFYSSLAMKEGEEHGEAAKFFCISARIRAMKGQARKRGQNKNYPRICECSLVPWLNFWQSDEKGCLQISNKEPAKLSVCGLDKFDIFFQKLWLQFTNTILQKQRGKDCGQDINAEAVQNNLLENYWPAFKTHKISRRTDRQHEKACLFLDAGVIWLSAKCQFVSQAAATGSTKRMPRLSVGVAMPALIKNQQKLSTFWGT